MSYAEDLNAYEAELKKTKLEKFFNLFYGLYYKTLDLLEREII